MKQLGSLAKGRTAAAGKPINHAKIELEAALAERRSRLGIESGAAEGADRFHACPAAAASSASCIR